MAIFASTTTSGYSDPLKAMSIKALEQRYKDMQTQQAAQQSGMFTPENTQTPIQGIGQVANVLADSFKSRRADEAVAAGRNELAGVIAQGPQGPNGEWSPQQQAVMSKRSPDDLTKIWEHMHQDKQNIRTEGGLNSRNTETIAGQNQRSDREIAGRAANVAAEQTGANVRQAAGDTTKAAIAAAEQAGLTTRQSAGFDNDARQARLTAELTQNQKDRDQAFTAGQTEKGQEHERKIVELKAELAGAESELGRKHEMNKLKEAFANDSKLAELGGALRLEQIKLAAASTTNDNRETMASQEKIQGLKAEQAKRQAEVEHEFKKELQTQAERATSADIAFKTASQEKMAASEAAAKAASEAGDPTRVGKITEMGSTYGRFVQTTDRLERALNILDNGGINTGPWARAETVAANLTNGRFGGSKDMAQRTIDFNNLVNLEHIKTMSNTLKGQTTNFEMEKFLEVLNNPNSSPEERKTALQAAVAQAKLDKELHRNAVKAVGGNPDTIDAQLKGGGARGGGAANPPPAATGGGGAANPPPAATGGGGAATPPPGGDVASVPRPAGKTDSDLIAATKAELATPGITPARKAAVEAQLQKWLMGP